MASTATVPAPAPEAEARSMHIAVTGATGFVSQALLPLLKGHGHTPVPLARGGEGPRWDPTEPEVHLPQRPDAVIHLAGEPISQRWSEQAKQRILASREHGTRNLATALASLDEPPEVLVCASAVGIYGDRGDEDLEEQSPRGEGFLADVVEAWEAAADPARDAGIRVVHSRSGLILHRSGGALRRLLLPTKLGVGGPVGSGRQWWPWVSRTDVCRALLYAATNDIRGPMNVTSPGIVRQKEFQQTLSRVLRRPSFAPLPKPAVRLLLGEMGEELLLSSQRVVPKALLEHGFTFQHTQLEPYLRAMLRRQ